VTFRDDGAKPAGLRRVELANNGQVTLTIHTDVFSLSPEDRAFIEGLLKLVEAYEARKVPVALGLPAGAGG
jgi:hypothetical protein